jgi:hypothetical protein
MGRHNATPLTSPPGEKNQKIRQHILPMKINLDSIVHHCLTKMTYATVLAGLVLAFVDPTQPSHKPAAAQASGVARTVQPGSSFV